MHATGLEALQQVARGSEVMEKRRAFEVLEAHLFEDDLLKLDARVPTATSAAVIAPAEVPATTRAGSRNRSAP